MAEVFAPFPIQRTMCNLTFYMMEGRNFVRKKSSLTRRKVLYSPQFARTRHNAGLMGAASKIGSAIYNMLPEYWRQGWMYRSFTGEAYQMLKAGKQEREIKQSLLQRYVHPVINKEPAKEAIAALPVQTKRAYLKHNTVYWQKKTFKASRRKAHKLKLLHNANLLARASKIGSYLYRCLPSLYKGRGNYHQLTAWVMQLLKDEYDEADIIAALLPALPIDQPRKCSQPVSKNVVVHPAGHYYFITSRYKRFQVPAATPLPSFSGAACDLLPSQIPFLRSTFL